MSDLLHNSDCQELRKLNNPPVAIKGVAGAILSLLGIIGTIDVRTEKDPRLWKFFRNNIYRSGGGCLLNRMRTLDIKSVTKEQHEMAKRFVNGLTIENVRNTSMATVGLYMWVCRAIHATAR